jgi:hypothetical protein
MLKLTVFCRGGRLWLVKLGNTATGRKQGTCPLWKGVWLDGFLGAEPSSVEITFAEGLYDWWRWAMALLNYTLAFAQQVRKRTKKGTTRRLQVGPLSFCLIPTDPFPSDFRPTPLHIYIYIYIYIYIWSFTVPVHHFSPDDGDSTLLWNVGFYQQIHTAIQQKITPSELSPPWKS